MFDNLRHNKPLDRFTLRGRKKVNAQWKLYSLVHNIEKLVHQGWEGTARGTLQTSQARQEERFLSRSTMKMT